MNFTLFHLLPCRFGHLICTNCYISTSHPNLQKTGTRAVIPGRDQGVLSTSEHSLVVQGNHEERHAGPPIGAPKIGMARNCKLHHIKQETTITPLKLT